jgi:hypothetical protein
VSAVHSTDAYDPVDARFAACGYVGFWGKLYSLEMPFLLGWVRLCTSQRTKYLRAFRAFLLQSRV